MLNYRKGIGIISTIIISLALYTFFILLIVIFLMLFQYNIELEIRDQYVWNKVQDVPLSLLSMDVGGEPLIYRANKVFYDLDDEDQFKESVKDITNKQIFYFFDGGSRPFGYSLHIFNALIEERQPGFGNGCACDDFEDWPGGHDEWKCTDDCGPKSGDVCGFKKCFGVCPLCICNEKKDHSLCFNTEVKYQMEYPIPLTFNGNDMFVDEIRYKVVEYHE